MGDEGRRIQSEENNVHPATTGETRNRTVDQAVAVQEICILHRGVANPLGGLTDHCMIAR